MPEGSPNLTPHFACSFQRPNLRALPSHEDSLLTALRAVAPSKDLSHVHDVDHLVSFTQHVRDLVARPVEIREVEGQRCVHVLGQAVFVRADEGTYDLLVWWRASESDPWALHRAPMDRTPFLDFPRTNLWKENLAAALLDEARCRIADSEIAFRWAAWAWSWVEFKAIALIDVRRLRSKIRGALDLDRRVLRALNRRRRLQPGIQWSMSDYNRELVGIDASTLVEREAPSLLPLLWGLRDHPQFDAAIEPKKALRLLARSLGVTPQQWRLIATSGRRGLTTYRALSRDFWAGDERQNALDYLALVRLLRPKRMPSIGLWSQMLAIAGSRRNPPSEPYAEALAMHRDALQHLVRLAETRAEEGKRDFPEEELHAVMAWVSDRRIAKFNRIQRTSGWDFLVRRALQYRARVRNPDFAGCSWDGLLPSYDMGHLRVEPLDSDEKLWDEAIVMRHCADTFVERCLRGETAIFSIRRHCGKRIATVAFSRLGEAWVLCDTSGKANSEPSKEAQRAARQLEQRLKTVSPVRPKPRPLSSSELAAVVFPPETFFADVNGIPVTSSRIDGTIAWDKFLSGAAKTPRRFTFTTLQSEGEPITEQEFRRRFMSLPTQEGGSPSCQA